MNWKRIQGNPIRSCRLLVKSIRRKRSVSISMNRKEASQVLAILKTAYPMAYRDLKKIDAENMVNLWTDMFSGDEGKRVATAVKACILENTSNFPPSIGAVKRRLAELPPERPRFRLEERGGVMVAVVMKKKG